MPLSRSEALKVIKNQVPYAEVKALVLYNDVYLAYVDMKRPFEEEMDPFFSVNVETGELRDFSVLTDGNLTEIMDLFSKEAFE